MISKIIRMALVSISIFLISTSTYAAKGFVQGIYLTQNTLENTTYLNYLIRQSKASGIDTFIIDIKHPSKRYRQNIAKVKDAGIKYVARVVLFHGGGTKQQVKSPSFWQSKYKLVKYAIDVGADEIQLDYIRYNTKQPQISQNAKDINQIVKWYKNKVSSQGLPMQIDVFGETAFGPSKAIGQDIEVFANNVDVLCPMVYPSHYNPPGWHYKHPYATIYDSLDSIQDMFGGKPPFKLIAWIEISNYRYRMSNAQKEIYLREQIEAVKDTKAAGFYVWSAHNRYDNLFKVLQNYNSYADQNRSTKRTPMHGRKSSHAKTYDSGKPASSSGTTYQSFY